jgi:hypothetical protein
MQIKGIHMSFLEKVKQLFGKLFAAEREPPAAPYKVEVDPVVKEVQAPQLVEVPKTVEPIKLSQVPQHLEEAKKVFTEKKRISQPAKLQVVPQTQRPQPKKPKPKKP